MHIVITFRSDTDKLFTNPYHYEWSDYFICSDKVSDALVRNNTNGIKKRCDSFLKINLRIEEYEAERKVT